MATSRFDRPAQAEFINTYAGLPLEELRLAAASKQAQHEQNLAQLDSAQLAAENLRAIPGSADEQYLANVRRGLTDLSTDFVDKDLSDPEIYRDLQRKLRGSFDRERIRNIQQSAANYELNRKRVAQLKAEGKYHEALDLDPTRVSPYDTSDKGVFSYQIESSLDSRAAAERYFDDLKASTTVDPKTGIVSLGVSTEDIDRVAEASVGDFMDTQAGVQAVKKFASRNNVNYDTLSNSEKSSLGVEYLREVGNQEFVYSRELEDRRDTDEITVNPWATPSDNTTNVRVGDVETIGNDDLPSGASKGYAVNYQPASKTSLFMLTAPKEFKETKGEKAGPTQEEIVSRNKKLLQDTKDKYGELLPEGITDEELKQIYNQAVNGLNNQSLGIKYIPEPEINAKIKKEILDSGSLARNFYVYDGHGSTEKGKMEEVVEVLGYKKESDVMDAIANASGVFFTQDGPEPGMYGVRVADKQGNSRNLLIGSNSNIQGMTSISNSINKKIRTLDDTPIVDSEGGAYRVKFTLNPTSKKFEYVVEDGYMDDDGKFVKQGEDVSLNAIKMQELNNLVDSPIIGTSFNFNTLPKLAQPTQSLFN
jgi:hypothetical protein